MLRIIGSTLSLVGSGRRSIVVATNGSQRFGGCNPVLTCIPKVTSSLKTEPNVIVICNPTQTELKFAKKFKTKSSIPTQICLSKSDKIQIHQYIEMWCDQKARVASAQKFTLWQQATIEITQRDHSTVAGSRHKRSFNNIPFFLQWTAPIACSFGKVAPGTTFTSWSKHRFVVIGKDEKQVHKVHTMAASNNKDPTSCSFYLCLFATFGYCSSHTSLSLWIAHSPQC